MNSPIYVRESVLVNVDKRQRLIDMIAVPWNQESEAPVPFMNGMMVRERFRPGAFDGLEAHAGRVPVYAGHDRERMPVGKLVKADPRNPEGLFTRAKVAATTEGDDMLQLADEDMLSPSIGYFMKAPSDYRLNRRAGTVEILRAFADHLGLVGVPAYAGARVLAVREAASGLTVAEPAAPVATPALDAFLSDPVLSWADSRVTRDEQLQQ